MERKNTITFLGTGTSQGIPVIGSSDPVCLSDNVKDKRLRTSALIDFEGLNILIDCGPDFRQQMLREQRDNIDALLLTHEHTDHIGGLDDLRPINFLHKKDIPLYGLPRVLEEVKKKYSYAFHEEKYPGVPCFELYPIETEKFIVKNKVINPIQITHGTLPILGYKIGNLVYITDASFITEEQISKITGPEILVINALRNEAHHSHFNLQQSLQIIEKIKPSRAYLTHISFQLGFHDEVEKNLPENIFLAYDGLKIHFN